MKAFAGKVVINLHVKSIEGKAFPHNIMQRIVELIYKYGFEKRLYFMAEGDVMQTALAVAPEIQRCMAAGSTPLEIVEKRPSAGSAPRCSSSSRTSTRK